MSFHIHPYSRPHPHQTHCQSIKSQSCHDVFGCLVLAPTTSYSNDDENLVDYEGYLENLRNIPPSIPQTPRTPPNYLVMPYPISTSNPSPNQPSFQSSTPITPANPINRPSPFLICKSPRKVIEEPQANPSPLANESGHLIQPCEVISDEASPSIVSPPSLIATISIPSIKLLELLPLPISLNILPPIKSLQNPSTPIQSYPDLFQKHVDIPQSIQADTIMPSPSQYSLPSTPPNQDPILPSNLLHLHDDRSIKEKFTIISKASAPPASNKITSYVPNNEHHIKESNNNESLDVGIPFTPASSQDLPSSPPSFHPSCSSSILGPYPTSFQPSILGPYIPYLNPPSFPSILGPYIPNMNPLSPPPLLGPAPSPFPSILGPYPYMPPYPIF